MKIDQVQIPITSISPEIGQNKRFLHFVEREKMQFTNTNDVIFFIYLRIFFHEASSDWASICMPFLTSAFLCRSLSLRSAFLRSLSDCIHL